MINDIDGYRIANSIVMDTFYGCHLIVEGINDGFFFRKFINESNCQIYVGLGKINVIEAIGILNQRKFDRSLGVVDKDFDEILEIIAGIENLFYSDFHDLEISLIESTALDALLAAHAKRERLESYEAEFGKKIRGILYELAAEIGYLRLANKKFDLGLSFKPERAENKPIAINKFIVNKTLTFSSVDELIQTIINFSANRKIKPKAFEIIKSQFETTKAKGPYDVRELCNGHDITAIIQLGLTRRLNNVSANSITQRDLEVDLIFAFDSREFEKTALYMSMKGWEVRHKRIFIDGI